MDLTQVGTFTRAHGRLDWISASGTYTIEFSPGEGNLSLSNLQPQCREAVTVPNRGTPVEDVEGDIVPVDFSITVRHVGKVTQAADPAVGDIVLGTGVFGVSSTTDPGGVVTRGNAVFTATRNGISTGYRLYNVRITGGYTEAKEGNSWAISGSANGLAAQGYLPCVPF